MYRYHRIALDQFGEKPNEARAEILEILRDIKKTKDLFQNSILIISFLDAKGDELVNIFSDGTLPQKRESFELLSKMDPTQTDRYKKILN